MADNAFDKFKSLVSTYSGKLPGRVRELETVWALFKADHDKQQLEILRRMVHSMRGSSGSYGYIRICDALKNIEQKIVEMLESNPSSEKVAAIDALFTSLDQLVLKAPDQDIFAALSNYVKRPNNKKDSEFVVFLLDKDIDLMQQAIKKLNQFEYKISLFDQLEDFITKINSEKPDMVIIDVSFAGDIPKDILKLFVDEWILVVYTTIKDSLALRLSAVRNGGHAFITKPFEIDSLVQTLDNLFSVKRSHMERILIVDNSSKLADCYSSLLDQTGFTTGVVTDLEQFINHLIEFNPDLILIGNTEPYCKPIELAHMVHQQEDSINIPIIFLASIEDKTDLLESLSDTGDDFFTNPVAPENLLAAIRNCLLRSQLLKSRMMQDGLTGLYNHAIITHLLDRELNIAKRNHRELSIILLDIDNFQDINTKYGYQIGDKTLKEFSLLIQKYLRKTDLIGRYGGDKFLIVLPNVSSETAFFIGENLREKLSNLPPLIEKNNLMITVSGGIATFPASPSLSELIKEAENLLLKAKKDGRNRIAIPQVPSNQSDK